jgi:hypothetical protein
LTEAQLRIFIRTLVRQVRYDGRTGKVTVRFDNGASQETAPDEVADRIEGKINEE